MDTLTPAERSERMGRVRCKDTGPELVVRRLVYGLGFRYRLHNRRLPGAPDLVFPRMQKAIMVHGCFWHRHSSTRCKLARLPKSKLDFWLAKLESNRLRDLRNLAKLRRVGWRVLVIWECQLVEPRAVERRIVRFLKEELDA